MSRLVIDGLRGGIPGGSGPGGVQEIVQGITVTVASGEVHAIMGPNGSGKSTLASLLLGRPGYIVTGGTAHVEDDDGGVIDLLALPTHERAHAGVFLAMQKPVEVPGVLVAHALAAAFTAAGRDPSTVAARLEEEADRVGFDHRFLQRSLNVDLSGGERKRNETIQLGVLQPRFAVLDEIDSGLDVDALRAVARRIEAATQEPTHERGLGVLAITHFTRLLAELRVDHVHVLSRGRIVASGGPELAHLLEADGYVPFEGADGEGATAPEPDPFGP